VFSIPRFHGGVNRVLTIAAPAVLFELGSGEFIQQCGGKFQVVLLGRGTEPSFRR
jgi:hypothetical protein